MLVSKRVFYIIIGKNKKFFLKYHYKEVGLTLNIKIFKKTLSKSQFTRFIITNQISDYKLSIFLKTKMIQIDLGIYF